MENSKMICPKCGLVEAIDLGYAFICPKCDSWCKEVKSWAEEVPENDPKMEQLGND